MSTSSLFVNRPLKPREAIAHLFSSIRATSSPGASRSASGMLRAPERRISSCVITKIAAAALASVCSRFDTDVTFRFIRSSRLIAVTSGKSWAETALVSSAPARTPPTARLNRFARTVIAASLQQR